MATITYAPAFAATAGFMPAVGMDTPCGGSAGGGVVPAPAVSGVTIAIDLGSPMPVTQVGAAAWYAGTSVDVAITFSSDGVTYSTYSVPPSAGPNHGGSYSASTLSSPGAGSVTARYWRAAYRENPQIGYSVSQTAITAIQLYNGATALIGSTGSCDYCGTGGELTVSGYYTRYVEHGVTGSVPHENCPVTLWYKVCASPLAVPCAHNPTYFESYPGSKICIDGAIAMAQTTTDCSGHYSFSVSGCITGFLVGLGSFVQNPAYSGCTEPFVPIIGAGPAPQWILDPLSAVAFGCNADTHWRRIDNLGNVLTGSNPPGGGLSTAAWIFAEDDPGSGPCAGTYGSTSTCFSCDYSGPGVVGQQNTPLWNAAEGQYFANPLTGSWTVNLWGPTVPDTPICYYQVDGKYYTVTGVGIVVSDSCGNTDSTYGGSGVQTTDWYNWVSGSVSLQNWTAGTCDPPLNTEFLGPDGVHNLLVQGPYDSLYTGQVQIYPNPFTMAGQCLMTGLSYGVQVQPPCTGAQAERLQADMNRDVLTAAWITSSGALKTACHRAPSHYIGSSTAGWEATETVETANADDIGMVYLPNESLYLTYLQSSAPVYRLNKALGEGSGWLAASAPSPLVARHSGSGRGEGQAFRFRALGTATTNGNLEFSQCRNNRGSLWTSPTVVTPNAQGPWCGGIFAENEYICLFSLAQTVTGLAAAGSLCLAKSLDGGSTWTQSFTGYSGQCGGIARTSQGVLVAVVMTNTPVLGSLYGSGWLQSRDNGSSWNNEFKYGLTVPALALPPVIAAQEDILYTVWVTGDQPQFLASRDGGISWY